ncbi:hypothetical protein LI951_02700 [Enterococcus sp. BWT-B8]|uniref:hypothetical protein n=1 Tax=Enterococcus sp. BWT-B8 TaxID=2885157 RepID=UPI001E337C88|nr:hypothetical protein [Enterococcus sp. BWT-B8]MCB5950970.1 hypothetical protein [Enterococcus sp. BWT-B8]
MEEQPNKVIKDTQPIKKVTHQDIYTLYDLVEQLNSWKEPLKLLESFFGDKKRPVNKQQIAKQYYAQAKIFNAFVSDFHDLTNKIDDQISSLRRSEKL